MNSVGAVIVASGYGGHGKKQNPMEEIDDLNVAVQIVVTFQRAGIKDIVVVCKEEKENLKKELRGFGVSFLNDTGDNEGEMFFGELSCRSSNTYICFIGYVNSWIPRRKWIAWSNSEPFRRTCL